MVAVNKNSAEESTERVYRGFAGIRDKESPLRSQKDGVVGLRTANNIDIDDNFKIKPAPGFTNIDSTGTDDIYYSSALKRCYIIRSSNLYEYFKDGTSNLIYTGIGNAGEWEDINGVTYFTNGVKFLVISGVDVRDWGIQVPQDFTVTTSAGSMPTGDYQITATFRASDGRESGALAATLITCDGSLELSNIPLLANHETVIYLTRLGGDVLYEALIATVDTLTITGTPEEGAAISTLHLSGPPGGLCITEHEGRICLGEYFPEINLSAIWRSEPLGYELFDRYSDSVILVTGRVNILGSSGAALIIGTDDAVYTYVDTPTQEYGSGLDEVLEVGSVGGTIAKDIDGRLWFWTKRGVATGMPFKLITDDYFAAPHAESGAGEIIYHGGFSKYNVILTGATNPINQYER